MLHYSEHEDVVVMDSSATSLANKLRGKSLLSKFHVHLSTGTFLNAFCPRKGDGPSGATPTACLI